MFNIIYYNIFNFININWMPVSLETYHFIVILSIMITICLSFKYLIYMLENTPIGYDICDRLSTYMCLLFDFICTSKVKFIIDIDGVEYIRIEPCDRVELDIWLTYFGQYTFSNWIEAKSKTGDIKLIGPGPYIISKYSKRIFRYPTLIIWLS